MWASRSVLSALQSLYVVSIVLTCVSSSKAITRAVSNEFWVVWVGQAVGAIVQPFILNAPPMLAANWFPTEQRTLATTICSVSNPIGKFYLPAEFKNAAHMKVRRCPWLRQVGR